MGIWILVSERRNGVSRIVKTYDGVAQDVEAIIRLKLWITDEITEELKNIGVEVV